MHVQSVSVGGVWTNDFSSPSAMLFMWRNGGGKILWISLFISNLDEWPLLELGNVLAFS